MRVNLCRSGRIRTSKARRQRIAMVEVNDTSKQPIFYHRSILIVLFYYYSPPQLTIVGALREVCGPDENRTHHSLLAREKRQPWNMRAQN